MKINIGDQIEYKQDSKIHRHTIYKLVNFLDDTFIMGRKEKEDDTYGYSAFYIKDSNIKIIKNIKTNFTKSDFTKYNYKQLTIFE